LNNHGKCITFKWSLTWHEPGLNYQLWNPGQQQQLKGHLAKVLGIIVPYVDAECSGTSVKAGGYSVGISSDVSMAGVTEHINYPSTARWVDKGGIRVAGLKMHRKSTTRRALRDKNRMAANFLPFNKQRQEQTLSFCVTLARVALLILC